GRARQNGTQVSSIWRTNEQNICLASARELRQPAFRLILRPGGIYPTTGSTNGPEDSRTPSRTPARPMAHAAVAAPHHPGRRTRRSGALCGGPLADPAGGAGGGGAARHVARRSDRRPLLAGADD